jgi:DNA-binding IclR family transcriptional regulator
MLLIEGVRSCDQFTDVQRQRLENLEAMHDARGHDASVAFPDRFRVLDVIELLARWGREMSHTEIADTLEIPKSSLTKLLKNLTARGFVEFVPLSKGYRLGEALIRLSQQSTHSRSLVSCAQPVLAEITQQTLESCALNQIKGDQVEVVATVTSPQRLVSHLRLGDLAPLYAVSGGKVILAFLPDLMRSEYIKTVKMQAITSKKPGRRATTFSTVSARGRHSSYVHWPRCRNARCASARLALWPVGAAKRERLFTRAARKVTALHVRSAIMPILFEVAPYDFRP